MISAVGCSSSSNSDSVLNPDTGSHPQNWLVDHRGRSLANPTQCQECYGADNRGGISRVSCFSASFNGVACHANGPRSSPYVLPFASYALHGVPAKTDPSYCQTCHGTPGAILFNGGLASTSCAACHPTARAHPTDWQGAGSFSHRNSGNRNVACTICHNVTAATPAGSDPAAPSCFSANFINALGQTRQCHAGGP